MAAVQGCKAILQEYKCHNCEVIIKENATVDQFIDIIEGNRRYLPCLYCYNKIDCLCLEELAVFATRDHSIVISIHWVNTGAALLCAASLWANCFTHHPITHRNHEALG